MPRKDAIHDAVRNALLKDGWTITDDPFRIVFEDADVYVDLRVEKAEGEGAVRRALVIEIKGFAGPSPLHLLENALGQYQTYRSYLRRVAPDDRLYLALDAAIHARLFQRPSFQTIVEDYGIALLVVDIPREEIVQWIP